MGHRLHVATKYNVEYSCGSCFNYKVEEFHHLLLICGADFTGESYDDEFEVSKNDWKKAIQKLKDIDSLDEDECMELVEAYENTGESLEEIIREMEYFLDKAEPADDYLHLCFF